jgi:hypothetical protein
MENNELDIGAMFATGTWTHRVDRKSVVWAFPHLEAQIRFDGKKIVHVTHRGETEMAFTFKARPLGECQQEVFRKHKSNPKIDSGFSFFLIPRTT